MCDSSAYQIIYVCMVISSLIQQVPSNKIIDFFNAVNVSQTGCQIPKGPLTNALYKRLEGVFKKYPKLKEFMDKRTAQYYSKMLNNETIRDYDKNPVNYPDDLLQPVDDEVAEAGSNGLESTTLA